MKVILRAPLTKPSLIFGCTSICSTDLFTVITISVNNFVFASQREHHLFIQQHSHITVILRRNALVIKCLCLKRATIFFWKNS